MIIVITNILTILLLITVVVIACVYDIKVLHMGLKLSSDVLFVDLWLRLWIKTTTSL